MVLALYNLRRINQDDARDGFYHWKLHVAAFLEKNWITIFGPQMKKRKTWLGTISGTMSHWSGVIFRSGLVTLKESGWWKLISEEQPRDLLASAPTSISRTGHGTSTSVSLLKKNKNDDLDPSKPNEIQRLQQSVTLEPSIISNGSSVNSIPGMNLFPFVDKFLRLNLA